MDEKQRRLIDYTMTLRDPRPPARPAAAGIFEHMEEVPAPPAAAAPISPESVADMLQKQRAAAGDEESILEGIAADEAADGMRRAQLPVERPVTERTIEVAMSATAKAINDRELDFEEQDVLEAIVLPGKRPVLDVRDGDFSIPPPGWEFLADYRTQIQAILPSIGRIDIPDLPTIPYGGTGFFVGDGLLMTNRHVARLFVDGVGAGVRQLRFIGSTGARFDPQYEVGDPAPGAGSDVYEIEEPLLVHPHWDMALLRVKPVGDAVLPPALQLARQAPSDLGGGAQPNIIVVGYPMLDTRNDLAEQQNIFRNIFGRKRLMPGYLTGFDEVATKWNAILHATTHDASTLGGNSGSAVVDLVTGQVLALHFGGRYLVANYSVPAWELARDSHVVALGVNFTAAMDGGGAAAAAPAWAVAWESVRPLRPSEEATPLGGRPAGTPSGAPTPAEKPVLPAAPDWFEQMSHSQLVEAMHQDAATTRALIRATLLPDEADDLIADLEAALQRTDAATTEEGIIDNLLGIDRVDPSLPEIIFLHGILGGHLNTSNGLGGRVWLSPLAFVAGGVARQLQLAADGEYNQTPDQILFPSGHVRLAYEKAARKWRMRGFVVHEFSYDWRKSVANAADQLHFFIESLRLARPAKRFALVGHSMGGLVATLYAARHPEWSARIVQSILLGAPLRGSYQPIEALMKRAPLLSKAALFDTRDDEDDFVAMLRSLPGLLDMLPDPDIFPDAAPLYARAMWPAASAPAQVWLDQSRQVKRLLATSPLLETARLIVALNHPTLAEMRIAGGQLQPGRQNRPGDGTVPAKSAAAGVPGVTVFQAQNAHGELPREDAVIDAVESLLKDGTCDLPRLTQQQIDAAPLVEEAVVEAVEEAVAADLTVRLRHGIFTQQDLDYLLRSDNQSLPGRVGD